jgi:tRNA dimethylallyltransferase
MGDAAPAESERARAAARSRVIVVLGPTAGGKSDLAMELARRFGGELVSADSMQVYRGMDIGTAKPTAAERAEIPHHLIDLVEASHEGFTVAEWLRLADQAIADIQARGRVPIVVGGTNLYIRAFLEGLDEAPPADEALRAELAEIPSEELHRRLAAIDAAAAARLHANDRRRVTRALEIASSTGATPSERRTAWADGAIAPRRGDLFVVLLDWPVELINRRINARVGRMVEAGLLDEVRGLLARGGICSQARAACGYEEFAEVVASEQREAPESPRGARLRAKLLDEAIERTKIRSRRLAKQQRTWLKRFRAIAPGLSIECDASTTAQSLAAACERALAHA